MAIRGIGLRQKGHSLVSGDGAGFSRFNLFMPLITRNTAKATIKKLITVLRKTPRFRVTAPAALAAARVAYGPAALAPSFRVMNKSEKSTLPRRRPMGA